MMRDEMGQDECAHNKNAEQVTWYVSVLLPGCGIIIGC
jgi:hypothetical protein